MPADIRVLKARGYDTAKLKLIFEKTTADREGDPKGKLVNQLISLHKQRISTGVQQNLTNANHYWSIDRAYDIGNRQTTFTMVQGLLDGQRSEQEVLSAVKDWGLSSFLVDVEYGPVLASGKRETKKALDLPTFFQIFVPVVMAYTKIRWAKLFTDRDQSPLYKYEPARLTIKEKAKCELITSRIERMSETMGYRAVERDCILPTLLYSQCLSFPVEDFYIEKADFMVDGATKEIVVKEGVRFHNPHPSRVFVDRSHPLHTINNDTGVSYMGYWTMVRYQELVASKYWNVANISYGKGGWPESTGWRVFQELYPCNAAFPTFQFAAGTGDNDREKNTFYYNTAKEDAGVNLTVVFDKIVPKDWGLYDYDKPVWHRFVYGGDQTVLWCEPMAYTPGIAYLYDYDPNRVRNSSLALELLPWQDHLGNLLTQYLLAVKQNLGKVVFYNALAVDKKVIDDIRNLGEKRYRGVTYAPIDKEKLKFAQQQIEDVFHVPQLPIQNTQEITMAINTMIGVMERMLGFSSQEVGAAASHEQSATESQIVATNTSVRMTFTGGFIDDARAARKNLLYYAFMAYGSDEVLAEVADLNDVTKSALTDMGFKVEDGADDSFGVIGDKKGLLVEGFSSDRDGASRANDMGVAKSMLQVFGMLLGNPAFIQTIGVKPLLQRFNDILGWAGVPGDWRFDPSATPEQAVGQTQEMLKQMGQQMQSEVQQVRQETAQAMGQMGQQLKEQVLAPMAQHQQQVDRAISQLGQAEAQTKQEVQQLEQQTAQALAQQGQALHQQEQKLNQALQLIAQMVQQVAPPMPQQQSQMPPNGIPPQ